MKCVRTIKWHNTAQVISDSGIKSTQLNIPHKRDQYDYRWCPGDTASHCISTYYATELTDFFVVKRPVFLLYILILLTKRYAVVQ